VSLPPVDTAGQASDSLAWTGTARPLPPCSWAGRVAAPSPPALVPVGMRWFAGLPWSGGSAWACRECFISRPKRRQRRSFGVECSGRWLDRVPHNGSRGSAGTSGLWSLWDRLVGAWWLRREWQGANWFFVVCEKFRVWAHCVVRVPRRRACYVAGYTRILDDTVPKATAQGRTGTSEDIGCATAAR